MKFDILNRFTGAVQFTAEIDCAEDTSRSIKIRMAVRWAISNGADLNGTDLEGAYLVGASLRDADLGGAYLGRADLVGADLVGADLVGADLVGADLNGADLVGADLNGANLLCMGDMRHIKTMQIDTWAIGYTATHLQIGCQRHEIDKWRAWATDAGRKWISKMDPKAIDWADRNLALVLAIIDANPAEGGVK